MKRVHRITDVESSFLPTGPQTFQDGDIVEIQMSFIVIPLRDQKSRVSVVLRSISLLDGQFTQVSEVRQEIKAKLKTVMQEAFMKGMAREDVPKTNAKPSLKRRVGYSDEELSATRAKLSSMAIDEEASVQENLLMG